MPLAEDFHATVDGLPSDWTDIELDLRILDENRYVEAATYLTQCNAQPYSRAEWHWRILVANEFGHASAAPTVHGALGLLDIAGIEGELRLREVREGRAEVQQMWGRPDEIRRDFLQRRSL